MPEPFTEAWMRAYRDRVNADPEMRVIGEWFSTPFTLSFGDEKYLIRSEGGRVIDVVARPRIDERWVFGFRAPLEVWQKFVSAKPPAQFHDLFAMLMRVPQFSMDGDALALFQNARVVHRMMTLLRAGEA